MPPDCILLITAFLSGMSHVTGTTTSRTLRTLTFPTTTRSPPEAKEDESSTTSTIVIATCLVTGLIVLVVASLTMTKFCRRRPPQEQHTAPSPTMIYAVTLQGENTASFFNTVTEYLRTSQINRQNGNENSANTDMSNDSMSFPKANGPPSYEEVIAESNDFYNQNTEPPPPSYRDSCKRKEDKVDGDTANI